MKAGNLAAFVFSLLALSLTACNSTKEPYSYSYAAMVHPLWSFVHNEVASRFFGDGFEPAQSSQPSQEPYLLKDPGTGLMAGGAEYYPLFMPGEALIVGGCSFSICFESEDTWLPSQNFSKEAVGTWSLLAFYYDNPSIYTTPFWKVDMVVTASDGKTVVGAINDSGVLHL